jgi:hypothetical protein
VIPGYTLDQTSGRCRHFTAGPLARVGKLPGAREQVGSPSFEWAWPPFERVIYLLKENRTYDQVLG